MKKLMTNWAENAFGYVKGLSKYVYYKTTFVIK